MTGKYFALAYLLLLLPCLSGCLAVAGGAAAGGATGYYISKEDRPSPQVDEDSAITTRVKSALASDGAIAPLNLEVDTYFNVVTLKGDAPNPQLAERAISIARAIPGVKGVHSEITVH